jgi:general secretion pathway protein G
MARIIGIGEALKKCSSKGFTLVELLLVLFLVALLASLVMPVATKSVDQANESALKENLHVLRKAIDDYYANTGRYPQSLAQLVEKRYIRRIPVDPLTGNATSWIEIRADDLPEGIRDIHSGAAGNASDGKPYRDW